MFYFHPYFYRFNDNFKDIFENIMVLNKGIISGQK